MVLMMTTPGATFFSTAELVPDPLLGSGTGLLLGAGAGTAGMALLLGDGAAETLDAGWYTATTAPAPSAPAASATAR
jgi:hypothetical protein